MPKEEYQIMKNCHDWHRLDREQNRISLRKVIEIINKENASNLNKMIRRAKNSQKQYINYNQEKQRFLRPRTHNSPLLNSNSLPINKIYNMPNLKL